MQMDGSGMGCSENANSIFICAVYKSGNLRNFRILLERAIYINNAAGIERRVVNTNKVSMIAETE